MKTHLLRDWNKRSQSYRWKGSHLLKTEDDPEVTDGYLKSFLSGKRIIVYRVGYSWEFCIDEKCFTSSDISRVELSQFGIFITLKITILGKKYKFTEVAVWDYFSRYIDPTYDNIDSEEVFCKWFVGISKLATEKR